MRHLVTGAGSGIGAALADALHARGDDLVLLARSPERAEDLAAHYPGAQVIVADLAAPGSVGPVELPGRLDSVVHAAGVVALGEVAGLEEEALRTQLEVNLVAPILLTRAALPALRAARGTVVFVNSTAGLTASAAWAAYASSKAGLRAVADALRAEEAQRGVRVTTVFPSRTATPMQAQVHAEEGRDYDPADWMSAASVAASIVHVLDLPIDVVAPEIVLRSNAR
ncbi:SDR family oxidoreductase [Nocardioides sp. R-C-SC26]|uniref:SDR family oxidoreductase n=1 Tax=Nocardioides sp. R-C-SC26 TaxID=2870414 RepID=UPI001E416F7A|nr:SDR family oxidoreductase [Nocardioides sp. R-C-SC26]